MLSCYMGSIEAKYAFPLFTHKEPMGYLLNNKDNVIVSDVWSFWTFVIKQWSKKQTKGTTAFLLSLLDQAKYFYQAAEIAPLSSQPLLYYYSFLNLGKIIISIRGKAGKTPSQMLFHHGIETNPIGKSFHGYEVIIKSLIPPNSKPQKISVGYYLMECFGDSLPNAPTTLNILDAMGNCVGIHRAYCLVRKQKVENFTRVVYNEITQKGKKLIARLYTEYSDASLSSIYNLKSSLAKKGCFFWEEQITMNSYKPTKIDYYNLSQALLKKGIWTYADGEEYIMYLSSNNQVRYSTASLIYCLMFFFGSITRYHPHLFETYLSEEYNWLVAEFLKTQPAQFLYISTSLVSETYVTKPRGCELLV